MWNASTSSPCDRPRIARTRVSHVGYKKDTVSKLKLRDKEYVTVVRHVLGLHHEHKREDRGKHIQVFTKNIVNDSSCKSQFAACDDDCLLLGDYHVKSVMHRIAISRTAVSTARPCCSRRTGARSTTTG